MKKILFLILIVLALPIAFACDMEGMDSHSHGNEITGADVAGSCGIDSGLGMMSGFNMMGYNWGLWSLIKLIIFLYFAVGFGYLLYKINKIDNKLKGGKK